jgi:hypothetical protein
MCVCAIGLLKQLLNGRLREDILIDHEDNLAEMRKFWDVVLFD